jgi:hypothetical protein
MLDNQSNKPNAATVLQSANGLRMQYLPFRQPEQITG